MFRSLMLAVLVGSVPGSLGAQGPDVAALRRAIAASGGRVLVMLKSGSGAALRTPGAPAVSASRMQAIEQRFGRQYPMVIRGRSRSAATVFATVNDAAIAQLLADSNVDVVEPDFLIPLTASKRTDRSGARPATDPSITWGDVDVGAPQAWAAGITGAGVKVGIIDGGIDYTHPYLNVVGGYDFTTLSASPSAYNDNVPSCDGHGTHVAGTVGAKHNNSQVVGVAPDVSLYALKVFEDFGAGCLSWSSNQMAALDWAVANGLSVVNMSLGSAGTSVAYQTAVTNAIAAGVTIVAAAGNSGGGAIAYPAAYTGVIAVGALDAGNTPAGYESVGPQMFVAAPGSGILSTMPGGGLGVKSGTSMASPHVVGVVALLVQAHPTWSVAQIQAALESSAIDINSAGFDNFTGWGLVQAPTTGSGLTPVVLALSPPARSVSVQQGNAAPSDNATVTLSGTNAGATAWSATKRQAWLTFTTSSGTGSGSVAWNRNASGLAVGTYVDTITISAGSVTGSPATIYDTLRITAAPIPVVLAVTPAARSVSVQQGTAAPSDNATVTLTGTNASSTAWSATKRQAWLTLTTASGTGSGSVAWNRNASGLAVGTYVDTITVSAGSVTGSPAAIYDTLRITAAPIPVVMALSPAARSVSVQQGNVAPSDNATVTLTGTNAGTTAWSATKRQAWLSFTTTSGTGSGSVAWNRNASGLAVGTYVDTITVSAGSVTGSPATIYDTLRITAAPVPVVLAVSPAARSVSVQQGNAAPNDNATVTLTGTNAGTTAWSATKRQPWLTFTAASGTGSGTVGWNRNASGLAVGTYVDTITVSAGSVTGSPAVVYDTLRITSGPIPVVLTVSPAARSVSMQQGNAAPSDNATVTLTGTNAGSTTWSASKRQAWLTFTNSSGAGSGSVTWNRNASGLAVGTYVDTITVSAGSVTGSPATIYDTLRITAAPIPVVLAVSPAARSVSVQQGTAAPSDNATVTLTGTNAGTTAWSATKRQAWLTFTNSSGTGSGSVTWNRNASGLAVGTYVDTITVSAGSVTGSPAVVYDTLKVTAAASPVVLALNPGATGTSVQQGSSAPGDAAFVTLTGPNAATSAWSATHRQSWLVFRSANGLGSGYMTWNRNAAGLAVGIYVDTITVTAVGATGSPATTYDTLKITAPPIQVVLTVSPAAHSVSAQQGTAAPSDNATVTLTGTNAGTTAWSATKRQAWLTFTTASGTGSGTVGWSRNASGLLVGIYVDTITVSAAGVTGSPAVVYDTLKITASPVPVVLAVSPAARSVSVQQGTTAPSDNATVTLTGTNAGTTAWSATKRQAWLTFTNASGTGSGSVTWNRNASGLGVGTYVDTVTVSAASAAGSPAMVYDTLRITATPIPVVIAVSPTAHSVSVQQGNPAPSDNAAVTLTGTNAGTTAWSATKRQAWLTFTTSSGTGSGSVAWNRDASGLTVGTYVDTITVFAGGVTGSPTVVYDTLRITAAPVPVVVAVSPGSRSISVPQGSAVSSDNASVTLSGTNATSTAWSATHRQSWAAFTNASGIGSGAVAWTRNPVGLGVGSYVDTITVTVASSGATAVVYDSLRITAATPTIALAPRGRKVRALQFSGATRLSLPDADSALVQASVPDSIGAGGWTATVSSSRLLLGTPSGAVNAWLQWSRPPQSADPGLYVDTVAVALVLDPSVQALFIDSLEVVAVSLPQPDVAVSDLFDHASLTVDQRAALDLQGNNNGRYDLGDLLAWVTRNHIQLSPSASLKVRQAGLVQSVVAPMKPDAGNGGGTGGP